MVRFWKRRTDPQCDDDVYALTLSLRSHPDQTVRDYTSRLSSVELTAVAALMVDDIERAFA